MNLSEFKYLLWDHTRKINDGMNAALNSCGARYHLSAMQLRILLEIEHNGPHTVGSLASSVVIAETNLSTMCKKLEVLGLLTRIRDRIDERIVRIDLTDRGRKMIEEINGYFDKKIFMAAGENQSEGFLFIIEAMERLNTMLYKLNKESEIE